MRLIDADAFDEMLIDAQKECKRNGGNFRFGVLSNVRENLRMMPSIEQKQRWIPVTELVPCDDEDVLIYTEGKGFVIGFREGVAWYDYQHNHLRKIAYWMRIPLLPEEEPESVKQIKQIEKELNDTRKELGYNERL